jgi:AraC-like DNA-binding protein
MLTHLIDLVERAGCDSSSIRQLRGLTDLTDPDLRVPEESVETAWSLAATLTRDPSIGIHLADALPRGALDLVEYSLRASATVGEGLERLARYGRVLSDRVAARMESQSDALILMVRDTGTTTLHHGRAEFALAVALKLARDGAGQSITPLHVSFAHQSPEDDSEHHKFFGVRVRFRAGAHSMILSADDAALPIRGADKALSAIVGRRLEKALATRGVHGGGPLSQQVRHLMVSGLGEMMMTPDTLASALAVSGRTLARRLAEEGTSFRELLDDVRREFASALLQDRSLSIADIAFFLQYSEPAAFNRSFRRWTGQTPSAFRSA